MSEEMTAYKTQSKLQILVVSVFLIFSGSRGQCEDAGELTRTLDTFKSQTLSGVQEQVCDLIQQSAVKNDLPFEFFAKLIWQESRFEMRAQSRAGAQGIAQFMPRTASSRGLNDPFDPVEALRESASYLRELKTTFGNLGLAAAAYNAGPGRLSRWLSGKSQLPKETIDYVQIVTGKSINEWSSNRSIAWTSALPPKEHPCALFARLRAEPRITNMPAPPSNWAPWGVQLIGNWTQSEVLASYEKLRRKHPILLGEKDPFVLITYGPSGMSKRFLVRVTEKTRQAAEHLCTRLQQEGASCFAVKNPVNKK